MTKSTFGDGIPFVYWVLLWLLGGVMAIVLIGYDFLLPFFDRMIGHDFANLWTGGRLALSGDAGCAFDVDCFRLEMYRELGLLGLQNYSYPPMVLLLDAPFALVPYYWALALWTVIGIAFFLWCARPYLPEGFPRILPAFTPAATINIWNGHYGFLFGGLWLLCFRYLDTKPVRAGVFAGLLTFKPHLGLMVAATVARKRTSLLAAIVTTLLLFALSAALLGLGTWSDFFANTTAEQTRILMSPAREFYFRMMPSAFVAFGRGNAGLAAQILSAIAAIALLVRYRSWDAFSAATATILLIPYVFNYDLTVVCLGFAILLFERWSSLCVFDRACVILAFLTPEMTFNAPFLIPPVLLAALNIQLRVAKKDVAQITLQAKGPPSLSPPTAPPGEVPTS